MAQMIDRSMFNINKYEFNSGINLAALVARRAESLLLGNGFTLKLLKDSEMVNLEADLIKMERIHKDNNLLGILSDVERSLSMNGEQAVIVDLDGARNVRYTLPESNSLYWTTTSGKLLRAKTYRRITYGIMQYLIMEDWGPTQKKSYVIGPLGQTTPIGDFNEKVPPELHVDSVYNYKELGRIPIELFQNLNSIGNKSEPDGVNVEIIQKQMDHVLEILYKETEMSRTRYGIDAKNEEAVKKINAGGLGAIMKDSILVSSNEVGSDDDIKKPIYVLSEEFKGDQYRDIINFYQGLYFDGSGYSSINNTNGIDTTVVGTMFTNRKDMETTRKKLRVRENQLASFQSLVSDSIGITSIIVIKLKTNVLYDEQSRMDYIMKGAELGLMPLETQIATFYNLTDKYEITTIIEAIEEESRDNEKKFNTEIENNNNPNERDMDNKPLDDKEVNNETE